MADREHGPVQIETPRFWLRSIGSEHLNDRYLSWLNDPDVVQWLNARFRKNDYESLKSWIDKHDNITSFHIGIFCKETSDHIGNFSIKLEPRHKLAMVNVLIGDKAYWGKSVVNECRHQLLNWLFSEDIALKVWAMPFVRNVPAVHNYKKQGFAIEGILKEHRRLDDGTPLDVVVFAMYKSLWQKLAVE